MLAGMRGALAMLAAVIVFAGCGGGGGDGDAAWLAGYSFRKRIDLHPPNDAALEDFPFALVTVADADLAAGAAADGTDLVVADADANVPRFELEAYDTTTGRLALWVRLERL